MIRQHLANRFDIRVDGLSESARRLNPMTLCDRVSGTGQWPGEPPDPLFACRAALSVVRFACLFVYLFSGL